MTWRRQRKIFLSRSTDGERTGGFFWREGKKKRVKVEEEEEELVVVVKEERQEEEENEVECKGWGTSGMSAVCAGGESDTCSCSLSLS